MTIEEFTELVQAHDPAYDYSDDHKTWKRGLRESMQIQEGRRELGDEVCIPIWNNHINSIFGEENGKQFHWSKHV